MVPQQTQQQDFQEILQKEVLQPLLNFYNKYQNIIIAIAGSLLLITVLAVITITRTNQIQKRNWEKIAMAQAYLYQKMYNEGFKLLDEIISTSKNSQYTSYALYTKATFLINNGDFATGKELCTKILEIKKSKSLIPHTLYLLGLCYQNLADTKNAIGTYNDFISKYPSHYLTPRVYESLALVYQSIGDIENAKNTYDKLNILYPGSYWSALAQKKLSLLQQTKK